MCPFGAPLRPLPDNHPLSINTGCALRASDPSRLAQLESFVNLLTFSAPRALPHGPIRSIARSSDSISDLTAIQRILCPSFAYHQTKASELQVEIKYEPQSRGPHLGRRGFIILRIPERVQNRVWSLIPPLLSAHYPTPRQCSASPNCQDGGIAEEDHPFRHRL